jgi:polyhydroxyalkanoate synthesis repressor PhaR
MASDTSPVLLKKYGNRRLYDTEKSAYVTLADVAEMVRRNVEIRVVDAKSGEDLTRVVLLQIIMEHQKSRIELLPIAFLRQLITYREDTLREFFDRYLEASLTAFASAETAVAKRFREGFDGWIGGMVGGASKLFPFGHKQSPEPAPPPPPPQTSEDKLLSRLDELERRLAEAEKRSSEGKKPKR